MIIIGITGTLGSGKGTVVDYLVREKGFAHYSARDFIVAEIKRRGLPVNRDSMTPVANSLREEHGASYIANELYQEARAADNNAVIESLRAIAEVESLKRKLDFVLFSIDAEPRIRYDRISKRQNETDKITYDKFLADEARELKNDEPYKQNISACMKLADYHFQNNGTVAELERTVEEVLKKII